MSKLCKKNYIGQKFTFLTVIANWDIVKKVGCFKVPHLLCKCDCGSIKYANLNSLINGRVVKCNTKGRHERVNQEALYKTWSSMKTRCYNNKHKSFNRYGGRGITVCKEWKDNFFLFKEWALNNNWEKGLQIDRINNNGNYDPSNCRVVTRSENMRNSGRARYINYNDQRLSLSNWADILGTRVGVLMDRLATGWTEIETVSTPIRKRKKSEGIFPINIGI